MSPESTKAAGRVKSPTKRRRPPKNSSTPDTPPSDKQLQVRKLVGWRKAEQLHRAVLYEEEGKHDAQHAQEIRRPT